MWISKKRLKELENKIEWVENFEQSRRHDLQQELWNLKEKHSNMIDDLEKKHKQLLDHLGLYISNNPPTSLKKKGSHD